MNLDELLQAIHTRTNGGFVELRSVKGGVTAMAPNRIGADGQCDRYIVGRGDTIAGALAHLAAMLRVTGGGT